MYQHYYDCKLLLLIVEIIPWPFVEEKIIRSKNIIHFCERHVFSGYPPLTEHASNNSLLIYEVRSMHIIDMLPALLQVSTRQTKVLAFFVAVSFVLPARCRLSTDWPQLVGLCRCVWFLFRTENKRTGKPWTYSTHELPNIPYRRSCCAFFFATDFPHDTIERGASRSVFDVSSFASPFSRAALMGLLRFPSLGSAVHDHDHRRWYYSMYHRNSERQAESPYALWHNRVFCMAVVARANKMGEVPMEFDIMRVFCSATVR